MDDPSEKVIALLAVAAGERKGERHLHRPVLACGSSASTAGLLSFGPAATADLFYGLRVFVLPGLSALDAVEGFASSPLTILSLFCLR